MEVKKTKKADLESSKMSSYLMGLVIGLAGLFVGFEWGTQEVKGLMDTGIVTIQQEELVEITRQEETPPPPPPPAPQQVIAEVLEVVNDDTKFEQQDIASTEDDSKSAQTQTFVAQVATTVQHQDEEEAAQEIFTIVEDMPQYPGGDTEMMRFLQSNVKYPVIAQENGVSGRVSVQFVVNRDGAVVDAVVVRGVDPSLDKEALRVVNSMPKWTPGRQRGKPVRVRYTVPVTFRLQ